MEAGFDYVRLSHYPQLPDFLDACDELGVVVMNCIPGWQFIGGEKFMAACEGDARMLIRRDRNHPCVVLWELSLNETAMPEGVMRRLHEIGHEEYPGDQMFTCGGSITTTFLSIPASMEKSTHGGMATRRWLWRNTATGSSTPSTQAWIRPAPGLARRLVSPTRMRAYARSRGQLAKTDRLPAGPRTRPFGATPRAKPPQNTSPKCRWYMSSPTSACEAAPNNWPHWKKPSAGWSPRIATPANESSGCRACAALEKSPRGPSGPTCPRSGPCPPGQLAAFAGWPLRPRTAPCIKACAASATTPRHLGAASCPGPP